MLDDLARDALDRALPLLDRVDDEFPGAQFFPEVIRLLLAEPALCYEFLVGVAEPQARNVVLVEDDFPFAVVLLDRDIRYNDPVGIVGEASAGRRVERADFLDGLLDHLGRESGLARQVGNAPA